jgi:flagellin
MDLGDLGRADSPGRRAGTLVVVVHNQGGTMRIYNNVNAINTQNQMDGNGRMMSKSLEKLSTGLRINRASDDAAGLSVSEGLRSQIRGSQMAQRNSDDATAMLQIAESGAQEVVNSLQRMRELALQSANGTYSDTDRAYIQQEYQQLTSEIGRISSATSYNGVQLLNGEIDFSFQVSASGTGTEGSSSISFSTADLASYGDESVVGNVSTQDDAADAVESIDAALNSVLGLRSNIGAVMNRMDKTITNLGNMVSNLSDAESRIRDVDFATESTRFSRNQILSQSSVSMLSQANQLPSGVLGLLR